MHVTNRHESLLLLIGDIFILYATLWVTLLLRYLTVPSEEILSSHLIPFSAIFVVWIAVFFIAGLYDKHTLIFKSRLPRTVFLAQLINVALAIGFFYLVPYFGITPKTNLFLFLLISFGFILAWRRYGPELITLRPRFTAPEPGLLVGKGESINDLRKEINGNQRYGLRFIETIDPDILDPETVHGEILNAVYEHGISFIVVDVQDERITPTLPHLYNLIYAGVHFIELHDLYEEAFDRIPLEQIHYGWFLEHLSFFPRTAYDTLKRGMDIFVSIVLGVVALGLTPFIALAIRLEDVLTGSGNGTIFYSQERIGQKNHLITLHKFRTMTNADSGIQALQSSGEVTRVGSFLRASRFDELPQLWSVLRGDLSLIGPRAEIPELVSVYEDEIPYYNVRHLIKPGLSGWAQLKHLNPPRFGVDTDRTKTKLSYDLYYVKNRSLFLDIRIALQTIKTLMSRSGR